MTLRTVRRFRVPAFALRDTEEAIRSAGQDGYELFVIWSGTPEGDRFTVERAHIPEQTSYKLDLGLCVKISGPALHRLNVWLYEARQVIGAQIHGHPATAYHSQTDDTYPIATLEGSLSVVLPFFGRYGWESNGIAVYRLGRDGWIRVADGFSDLIEVVDNGSS